MKPRHLLRLLSRKEGRESTLRSSCPTASATQSPDRNATRALSPPLFPASPTQTPLLLPTPTSLIYTFYPQAPPLSNPPYSNKKQTNQKQQKQKTNTKKKQTLVSLAPFFSSGRQVLCFPFFFFSKNITGCFFSCSVSPFFWSRGCSPGIGWYSDVQIAFFQTPFVIHARKRPGTLPSISCAFLFFSHIRFFQSMYFFPGSGPVFTKETFPSWVP